MSSVPDIQAHFDRIAAVYDGHAALEQEVCRRLVERSQYQQADPQRIVDLGCGTGAGAAALKARYPKALVAGLDLAPAMLARTRGRGRLLKPLRAVCADIGALPLVDGSVDLVFSSMAAFWTRDPVGFFAEVRRVLRPGGMFLFSTLGRDTFSQLRAAWSVVDPEVEVPAFPDIMEIGDALAAAGFAEPTLDTDFITLEYPRIGALCAELEATGSSLLVRGWSRWKEYEAALEQAWRPYMSGEKYPLGYEIVYGAAFGPAATARRRFADPDVVTVPLDSLLKSRPLAIVKSGASLNFT